MHSLIRKTDLYRFIRKPFHLGFSSLCTETDKSSTYNLFFDEKVQVLLKQLTGRDLDKIFRERKEGIKLQQPEYQFMDDEQLAQASKDAELRADMKLQMPPVMAPRKEIEHVLAVDEHLKDLSDSKFVYTDITYGKNDRNRVIVVREPDGSLRKANWEERDRMNEIYFPRKGRKLVMPKMFEPEFLKDILDRKDYLFVLDRACVQFEPDHPDYVRVTETTYQRINELSNFDALRSTRHYGPLVFYLALNNNIDNLLLENIETDRLLDAVWAIELYNILNPGKKCNYKYLQGGELNYVKAFIQQCAVSKGKLELALNKYKDMLSSPGVQALN